ncbi:neural cell adhesion molecule 2-like [Ictalurus furcatus]|uniref:neural cell adhesion molecule 2-like n=1 Tax=Ictalurus furcatus TaxID=66913 RepID=UPI0023500AF7|nr:neural cell adhesion molecule 2-like [Ictalurus furcatus]
MKRYIVFSLLLAEGVLSAQSAQFSQSGTEGTDIILHCENKERVFWSKSTESESVERYILRNKEDTTVYKRDPDDRYIVLPDSSLMIKSLSLSDSGIYYCNGYAMINLTVTPLSAGFSQSRTEGRNIKLPCDDDGEVLWTKHTNDKKVELILFVEEEKGVFICKRDPDSRYIVLPDSSLLIKKALVSDSGIYHCDGDLFINLTIMPSEVLSKSLANTYTAISATREATANGTEGSNIILHCESQGEATWSKYNDEGRMDLHISQDKGDPAICKLDLDNHFNLLSHSSLGIRNLSLSDSGIYYCNDAPVVNLTVTPLSAQFNQTRTEGTNIMLYCYSEERAFWTKDINEVGLDVIFSQEKENTITYKRDPDKRYTILSDSSLVIRNAVVSDSGIYYCKHSPVVNLTVFPLKGGVSEVERVLMFGGVGLAFLSFLLATVAASRVVFHQAWQAGRDSVQPNSD